MAAGRVGVVIAEFRAEHDSLWDEVALALHDLADAADPAALIAAQFTFKTLDGIELPADQTPFAKLQRGEAVSEPSLLVERRDRAFHRLLRYASSVVTNRAGRKLCTLRVAPVEDDRGERPDDESAKMLRQLLDQFPGAMWTIDPQMRVTLVGGRMVSMLGLDPVGILGQRLDSLFSQNRPDFVERHRRALEGEVITYEDQLGRYRTRAFLAPMTDETGAVIGALGAARDVSAEVESARALREANERMQMAQHIGHFGSWELGYDGAGQPVDPLIWSDEMYRLVGLEPGSQVISMGFTRTLVHPDDLATFDAVPLRWDHENFTFQVRMQRADGAWRHVRIHGRDVVEPGSKHPSKRVGTMQDVTVQQEAADEVRRLNAELEQRVAARTSELKSANFELEAFAYAVSHDLRAPLRAMGGFSRALLEDKAAMLDDTGKDYLRRIANASESMGNLIDALLSLSRASRGELYETRVDLSEIAQRVVKELEAAEPGRHVDADIEPGLQAHGDSRMLEIVIRNLFENAWKYTARSTRPTVRFFHEDRDGSRWFTVADNGAGFSMNHADRLFQPFQRLHSQSDFPGIGIGLATVQRVVHRHGGTVRATSQPGAGATFQFSLSTGQAPAPG